MSVVIVGGNDCMICQYKSLCKKFGYRAKVFTQMTSTMKNQIGSPDLLVLFTGTVSHKMIRSVLSECKGQNLPIARCHSSSLSALRGILEEQAAGNILA